MRSARLRSFAPLLLRAAVASAVLAPAVALAVSAAGRPAFQATDPEGLYIWHDEAGWHVRATAGADQHSFRGVIRGAGFSGLTVTRPALGAKVTINDPTVLRFEFDVFKKTIDGFDWKSGPGCVTLELKIDGRAQPQKVRLGAKGEALSVFPADACP